MSTSRELNVRVHSRQRLVLVSKASSQYLSLYTNVHTCIFLDLLLNVFPWIVSLRSIVVVFWLILVFFLFMSMWV